MNRIAIILMVCILSGVVFADVAEFQLVVNKNDATIGGDFWLDLQMRETSGSSANTLSSMTVDVAYNSIFTGLGSSSQRGTFVGPTFFPGGYTNDVSDPGVSPDFYYRVTSTGGNVKPGVATGWDVSTSWQTVVTLKWLINTIGMTDIEIVLTDAQHFLSPANDPEIGTAFWTTSALPFVDFSLPVQISNIEASVNKNDGVLLNWRTESEVNSSGFHVWRKDGENGSFRRVTTELLPSQGNSSSAIDYSFSDPNVQEGITYHYKIQEIDMEGQATFVSEISVQGIQMVPTEFDLSQNYPNPFNPQTTLHYQLAEDSKVSIRIFSLLGEEVGVLVNEKMTAGYYTLVWDGTNKMGQKLASGIYFIRIDAENFTKMRKMTIMR